MNKLPATSVFLHAGLLLVGSVVLLFSVCAAPAHADTIVVNKNVMVSMPAAPQIETLNLSSPGKLTVTLSDIAWPKILGSLSFAITSTTDVLAKFTGAGSLVYDVASPGALFAAVYAQPDPTVGTGLYHINVSFAPAAQPAPVPLPAGVWLLLSGMCGFAALRGKHATVTNSIVQ